MLQDRISRMTHQTFHIHTQEGRDEPERAILTGVTRSRVNSQSSLEEIDRTARDVAELETLETFLTAVSSEAV